MGAGVLSPTTAVFLWPSPGPQRAWNDGWAKSSTRRQCQQGSDSQMLACSSLNTMLCGSPCCFRPCRRSAGRQGAGPMCCWVQSNFRQLGHLTAWCRGHLRLRLAGWPHPFHPCVRTPRASAYGEPPSSAVLARSACSPGFCPHGGEVCSHLQRAGRQLAPSWSHGGQPTRLAARTCRQGWTAPWLLPPLLPQPATSTGVGQPAGWRAGVGAGQTRGGGSRPPLPLLNRSPAQPHLPVQAPPRRQPLCGRCFPAPWPLALVPGGNHSQAEAGWPWGGAQALRCNLRPA